MTAIKDIVATIPGWERATVTPLDGGSSARTWLLEQKNQRAVLKADTERREGIFGSRQYEAVVQNRAADAGLAPAVLYATDTVLLTEYVASPFWSAERWFDTRALHRLGKTLRKIHQLPMTGKPFQLVAAAQHYLDQIDQPSDAQLAGFKTIEAIGEPDEAVCCHNDLVVANITGDTTIQFIDWEYAADNTPLFDLATVIEHHNLGEAAITPFLSAYFAGQSVPWQALADQRIVYRELRALWQVATSRSEARGA